MAGYSISVSSEVMERFDEFARKHKMNRSQAIERLMDAAIKQEEKQGGTKPEAGSGPKTD